MYIHNNIRTYSRFKIAYSLKVSNINEMCLTHVTTDNLKNRNHEFNPSRSRES